MALKLVEVTQVLNVVIIYCGFKRCFPFPLSGYKTIRGLIKEPLKYPNVNKLGNFGLSSVMVSENVALVLQHFVWVGGCLICLSACQQQALTYVWHTRVMQALFGQTWAADIMLC